MRGGQAAIASHSFGALIAQWALLASENPAFTIPFRATEPGPLKFTFFDTHGSRFEGTVEVKPS